MTPASPIEKILQALNLPRVILLGNSDAYVQHLRELIRRSRGALKSLSENGMAYSSDGLLFVHVSHPSRGNGHFGAFVRGEGKPGAKMRVARDAIADRSRNFS